MNHLKTFIHFFVSITTAECFIIALLCLFHDYDGLSKYIILQILGAAFITAGITTIVFSFTARTKLHMLVQIGIHYSSLCVIMGFIGSKFHWVATTFSGIATMCMYVFFVYACVSILSYLMLKKEADQLNEALNRRKNNKKEMES